jgi:hypothetical protein
VVRRHFRQGGLATQHESDVKACDWERRAIDSGQKLHLDRAFTVGSCGKRFIDIVDARSCW